MLRNYLAAALRNLVRNRAYAAINLLGLALGYTAAILIALYVRDEFTFDQSFPQANRIYQVGEFIEPPGSPSIRTSVTTAYIAPTLQLDFPEIDLVTRLVSDSVTVRRKGGESATPTAYWADPTFFQMFPMKAFAGDLAHALSSPDDLVLTHREAQQLFGRDDVVGETLEINREHILRIVAVVEDLPSNSNLSFDILLPAIAGFSATTALDAVARTEITQGENVHSYVRLRSDAGIETVRARLRSFADRHVPGVINGFQISKAYTFVLTPLPAVHFLPAGIGDMKPPGDLGIVRTLVGIAILILCVAGGNFVSMMTARAARRALEVGVRKAVGATRRQLMSQFLGESLFYSILAFTVAAIAVAALGLLGLAISTAERRTKEIGLRKVLGAKRVDILRFLAWQFARPVLWANFLAWPCTYFLLQRWLEGFAYHIDQSLLLFIAAAVLALVIAFITVFGHAMLVARAKPVEALRYE